MYCFVAQAQENKISVTEVHILSGAGGGYAEYGSIADFKSLAPNSEILKKDFTGFDDRSGGMNGITGMNVFQSLQIGLKLPKLKNAVLRLGVMHMEQSDLLTRSGHRSTSFAYDTLVSTQTGEQYFIDSLRNGAQHLAPELRASFDEELRGFIGQEATHRRIHALFNAHLERQGHVNRIEQRAKARIESLAGLDLRNHLAATAATEHFTALFEIGRAHV